MNEKKIKVLIVDDESLARDYIRRLLGKNKPEFEIIGEASNGKLALQLIAEHKPDLVFLDVQMPETDGFQMLEKLDRGSLPIIIFTTAYEKYAIRAFEFHAIDYLLKPFDQKRFNEAVDYARTLFLNLEQKNQTSEQITELLKNKSQPPEYLERLLIKQKGRVIFLKVSEIDLIKADDKYVHLHFGESRYMIRQTLSAMLRQLDPQKFIRIHRSFIVNQQSILELHPTSHGQYDIILKTGRQIPLSQTYRNDFFEVFGKPL